MEEFLSQYNLLGISIGLATFLIIGLFHPIVIKAHYHYGTACWWWFLIAGLVCVIASLCVGDLFWSTVLGVTGFSSFWTVKEVFDQEKRVAKGWFPANPKRNRKKCLADE
ncbi:MAG: DUF4491 family protein [Paramuribaculum sp.]|nr:DUF4491 family protein [Paramuribaculum sp.]